MKRSICSTILFRNFEMRLLKRNNYPAYTLNNPNNVILKDGSGIPLMISHKFDQQELGFRVKKWRKDDINFGNAPVRGMLPLRHLYYRTNEAKIPAMR